MSIEFKGLRLSILLVLMITSIMALAPSFYSAPTWWPASLEKPLSLGLDLKGGIHFTLEVDVEASVKGDLERVKGLLRTVLKKESIKYRSLSARGLNLILELKDKHYTKGLNKLLRKKFPDYKVSGTGRRIYLKMNIDKVKSLKRKTIKESIEVLRRRVDSLGVVEPVIIRQGLDRILLEIPGFSNIDRAKALIGKTARLEFRLVDDKVDVTKAFRGIIPHGDLLIYSEGYPRKAYLVKDKVIISGKHIKNAKAVYDNIHYEHYVSLKFNRSGKKIIHQFTKDNLGKRFVIILEDMVYSAPYIKESVAGDELQIHGKFSKAEASDFALIIRAGALPVSIKLLEERIIGPSLGQDSINKGLYSIISGFVLIIIFMLGYYRFLGVIAITGLCVNLIFMFAAIAILGVTITLPSLAGIILTIGMSIDGSIIIFEKIREELSLGKSVDDSIKIGYQRSFKTILDANITTLIAGVVLFQFGFGIMQGFAITLCLGIVISILIMVLVTAVLLLETNKLSFSSLKE